jgi:hypothetical protein
MSPENRARVDALCREISALGSALDAMHQELLLLRDEMRGSLVHDEPEPMKEAA